MNSKSYLYIGGEITGLGHSTLSTTSSFSPNANFRGLSATYSTSILNNINKHKYLVFLYREIDTYSIFENTCNFLFNNPMNEMELINIFFQKMETKNHYI
ncbi:hypothetical protein DHD08_00175 [Arenibacter sp. H213]|nr:hypothetical protein [Arenibacter sp. H213]